MVKNGLVLYQIEMDGCLNGVYTNEPAHGIIYNEIARKINREEPNVIQGDYTCSWIDEDNDQVEGVLIITPRINNNRILDFRWTNNEMGTNPVFVGIGYQMNPRQIAVYYHSVDLSGTHPI